ncbi:hypothetical protein Tco_0506251 [Tanacetum coccineum]
MKETKAYKTYIGFTLGATPPKKARRFKKLASPKLTTVPASIEEPTGKSKRVKRPAKKSTQALARGVVIRETPEIPVSKKMKKVDVARGKGIELLSYVALTEEAYNNDQDSGSEESDQDKDSDDDKSQSDNEDESDSEHETDDNESGSESDQEEDDEKIEDDEEEEEEEIFKTLSNDSNDKDETKIVDKAEGDEDEEMDYNRSLLYDDVDIRINEPVDVDKGFVQEEGTNDAMTNKTEVPVTSSSRSSDLAVKFLNFSDIPTIKAEIVSPLDVPVHHEVSIQQTPTLLTVPVLVISNSSHVFSTVIPQSLQSFTPPPLFRVTTLEQEVAELKKDPLQTQVTVLVDEHLDAKLGVTRDEFMNFLSASLTARITKQVKDQLPQILPKVVSNIAPPEIERMVTELLEHAILAKESSQP